MPASARELVAAGVRRGLVLRVAFLLVAEPTQLSVGVRVGEVGQAVGPHALRELPHLLDKGWVSGGLMFAAWGQVAALRRRGLERRVAFLLVGGAAKLPLGVRVGEVGHTVVAHALRKGERALPRVLGRRLIGARRRAASRDDEDAEQRRGRR